MYSRLDTFAFADTPGTRVHTIQPFVVLNREETENNALQL